MLTEERVVHVVLWTTTNETALRSRRRQKVIYFRILQTVKRRFSELKARKEKEEELVAEIEGEEEEQAQTTTKTKTQPAKKPEVKEKTKAKVVKF